MRQSLENGEGAHLLSRRERNKREKRTSIMGAARRLFVELGYDQTTVRMIADEANVGLGTVFAYATDKRDLLFLIVNEGLGAAWLEAEVKARAEVTLIARLRALFHELYVFFGAQPTLARYVLRELQFYKATEQAALFQATRERTLALVEQFVREAIATGELRKDLSRELAARLIFSIYQAEIRRWLIVSELDVDVGVEDLCVALALLIRGLAPTRMRRTLNTQVDDRD